MMSYGTGRGFEGWVVKRGSGSLLFSHWRKRYLVIFNQHMYYYTTEKEARKAPEGEYRGKVSLSDVNLSLIATKLPGEDIPEEVDENLILQLQCGKVRKFVFASPNQREMNLWMDSINARMTHKVNAKSPLAHSRSINAVTATVLSTYVDQNLASEGNQDKNEVRQNKAKQYFLPERLVDYFLTFRCAVPIVNKTIKMTDMKLTTRYPIAEYDDLPVDPDWILFAFPSAEEKLFCLDYAPPPRIHYAVLCSGTEKRTIGLHAVFLTFYERIKGSSIYEPVSICLLSHYPQFQFLSDSLVYIHDLVFARDQIFPSVELEPFISYIIDTIPFPTNEHYIEFPLSNYVMKVEIPPLRSPICSNFSFNRLFGTLNVDVVLDVLEYIFKEARVLFHSSSLQQLVIISQCFLQLIYPFEWKGVYIPLLPKKAVTATQIVGQFILGIATDHLFTDNGHLQDDIILEDLLLVDIDMNKAEYIPFPKYYNVSQSPSPIPISLKNTLEQDFVGLLRTRAKKKDLLSFSRSQQQNTIEEDVFGIEVSIMMLQFFRTLFLGFRDFTLLAGGRCLFIMDEFIQTHILQCEEIGPCIKTFAGTQMFKQFLQKDFEMRESFLEGESLRLYYDMIAADTNKTSEVFANSIRNKWSQTRNIFHCEHLKNIPLDDCKINSSFDKILVHFDLNMDTLKVLQEEKVNRIRIDPTSKPFLAFKAYTPYDSTSVMTKMEKGLYRFWIELILNQPDDTMLRMYSEMLHRTSIYPNICVDILRFSLISSREKLNICIPYPSLVMLSHIILYMLRLPNLDFESVSTIFNASTVFYSILSEAGVRSRKHGASRRHTMQDIISTLHPYRENVAFWVEYTKRQLTSIKEKNEVSNYIAIKSIAGNMSLMGVTFSTMKDILHQADISKEDCETCCMVFSSDQTDDFILHPSVPSDISVLCKPTKEYRKPMCIPTLVRKSAKLHERNYDHEMERMPFYFASSGWHFGFFRANITSKNQIFSAATEHIVPVIVILSYYHLYLFDATIGVNEHGLVGIISPSDEHFSYAFSEEKSSSFEFGYKMRTHDVRLIPDTNVVTLIRDIHTVNLLSSRIDKGKQIISDNICFWKLWIDLVNVLVGQ